MMLSLYRSVHGKGVTYEIKAADEVLSLVCQCKLMKSLLIYKESTGISETLNGPKVHVSAKTLISVEIIELLANLSKFH